MQDKVQVVSLASEKAFPPGLQPAFAIKAACLVLGTSPAAIQEFAQAPQEMPRLGGGVLLLRFSAKELVAYLEPSRRRELIASAFAAEPQAEASEIRSRLDLLVEFLRVFDRVEVVQKSVPGQVQFTFHLHMAKSLSK
jgi:hypothetical protein